MRAFIILGFLAAAASGQYSYGPGISSSYQGVGSLVSGGTLGGSSSGLLASSGGSKAVNIGSSLLGGASYGSGVGSVNGGILSSGGSSYTNTGLVSGISSGIGGAQVISSGNTKVIGLNALDNVPQTVELSKQFFHFEAPEEIQNEGAVTQQLSNVLKKNLQVVFIKAPENNAATSAALQLAKQAIEQRSAIYVLVKENDNSQFVAQLQQIQENVPTTPEVKFIKYRTAADIATAKSQIQSQYDSLGGESQTFDGGIAPVLNYASQGSGYSGAGTLLGGGTVSSGQIVGGGSNYASGISTLSGSGYYGSGTSGNLLGLSGSGSPYGKVTNIGGGNIVASSKTSNYLPPTPLK